MKKNTEKKNIKCSTSNATNMKIKKKTYRNVYTMNKNINVHKNTTKRSGGSLNKLSKYKNEILEVDKDESKYDALFEKKLAEEYRIFRNIKEHNMQVKKYLRILAILVVIILLTLLFLSYS